MNAAYARRVGERLRKVRKQQRLSLQAAEEGPAEVAESKVTIDLTALEASGTPERDLVSRYLGMIQVQRQDFNGRVLTIRGEDLRAIACLLDTQPEQMRRRLEELGLRR